MDNVRVFLLELFFPSFCLGCKKEGVLLCQDCKATLEISEYNYCLCSQHPLRLPAAAGKPFDKAQGSCSRCAGRKLSGLYFALPYKEKFLTRKLIYQFKYEPYLKSLSAVFAEILLEHFVLAKNMLVDIWENSVLIPVPLEIKKQKSRGYNQAQEVARQLSEHLKIPAIENNLVKIKKSTSQTELSAKERQENVMNSFAIKNPAQIAGKKIFLVDDVYTTGATMEECARTLKEAGAESVWGIAIAREG